MIELLVIVIVLALVWYLIEIFIPGNSPFKVIAQVVCVLILILFLLSLIGYGPGIGLRLPR